MRALTPLMFQVAILIVRFAPYQKKAGTAGPETCVYCNQIVKLVPQPQPATALGLLIWKD